MSSSVEMNQRIARLLAHLYPPNMQVEDSSSAVRRADCRAKGGAPGFKVPILGAAGGIGQPLAMLMKMNPLVSVLHLRQFPSVTADISYMDTRAVELQGVNLISNPVNSTVPIAAEVFKKAAVAPLLKKISYCAFGGGPGGSGSSHLHETRPPPKAQYEIFFNNGATAAIPHSTEKATEELHGGLVTLVGLISLSSLGFGAAGDHRLGREEAAAVQCHGSS
ncbi:PREDICTED: malate dehydrogenase, glyoxysomal-like [Fragaria vesca subsp. vesca]